MMNDRHTISACATFDSLLQEHKTAIWGVRMLASSPNAEALTILLRLHSGLIRSDDIAFDDAEKIVEIAESMVTQNGFHKMRVNLLIALCSSVEHATKAFFVDGVINRPQQQRDWDEIRLAISNFNSYFENETSSERYFEVASDLWNTRTARRVPTGRRLVSFILEKCATAKEPLDQKLFNVDDLNEAFTMRNAFVHNGGLPTPHLKRHGFVAGELMVLAPELLTRYVVSLKGFNDALLKCTDQITMDDLKV